jgi:drug/metabolite transporter (DMT)-like permease
METVYNTAVGYQRMKMYSGMGIFIIIGIIMIICAIMSIMNKSPPQPPINQPPSPSPTSTPVTNTLGWPWLILIGFICFIVAYGFHYMATNKSMENVLAAQTTIEAASSVSNMFNNNRGGVFDIGE